MCVRRRRPRHSQRIVAARLHNSPGERQEKPGIPILCVPQLIRPCLLRSPARRGGGLEMTTRGTAYLGTHRPSSLSCVRISSREAARWRATWINNSIPTRATAEGPPLLWKLHLQVNWTFMALKSRCRSFQSLIFGLDLIWSAVFVSKSTACWRGPQRRDAVWSICRRFSLTTDGLPDNCSNLCSPKQPSSLQ